MAEYYQWKSTGQPCLTISIFSADICGNCSFYTNCLLLLLCPLMFLYYYFYYWYSALGPVWADNRVQSGDWYGSGTLHPGQVLRGSLPLLSPAFQMFPLFTTRCLHVRHDMRDPSGGIGNWARMLSGNFAELTTSMPFRDLLHAANLQHGTDGFTSPLKGGGLKMFSPLKIRRLRPGLNLQTWVLKASTLPLDHQSRYFNIYGFYYLFSLITQLLAEVLQYTTSMKRVFYLFMSERYLFISILPSFTSSVLVCPEDVLITCWNMQRLHTTITVSLT